MTLVVKCRECASILPSTIQIDQLEYGMTPILEDRIERCPKCGKISKYKPQITTGSRGRRSLEIEYELSFRMGHCSLLHILVDLQSARRVTSASYRYLIDINYHICLSI